MPATSPYRCLRITAHLLLAVMASGSPAVAQITPQVAEQGSETVAADVPMPVREEYASPGASVRTLLQRVHHLEDQPGDRQAWKLVFGILQMPATVGDARKDVVWKLFDVLERIGVTTSDPLAGGQVERNQNSAASFELFPNNPNKGSWSRWQALIDELGQPPGRIVLVKARDGAWQFSGQTLQNINQLHSWIEKGGRSTGIDIRRFSVSAWVRSHFPEILKDHYFLTLEYWQWIGIFALIFISVIVDFAARFLIRPLVRATTQRYLGDPDESSLRYVVRPIGLFVGALLFLFSLPLLGLTGMALTLLIIAARVVLTVGLAWASWAITDLAANVLLQQAEKTETAFDNMAIPLVRKTLKLFIIAVAVIYLADALDLELTPLIGGLGLAGLAVSFAAQDLIRNLFGGLMVFLDRPFHIGERINYAGYDGVIEEIGFRTTRLRTLTGHLVTIPNGSITSDPIENIGRRPFIRRTLNVTITYDTPHDKIQQGVQIIRDILEEDGIREPIHPTIKGDELPPRVYFNDYADVSLNILVLYWFAPPEYWDYLEHGQRFNLRLFEEFEKAGIEFAFPTQTLYLAGDPKRELVVKNL